jgi:hypothetical protein
MATKFNYDVAFSFAGEDRKYVGKVAEILHQIGVRIFYDDYERVDLWGKDLYSHLDEVYRKKSKYCVVFVSKFYKRKLWTNHERESAQARAFKSRTEYILPARFDDIKIPGMRATRGYIDLRTTTPEQLADMLLAKLGLRNEIQEMTKFLEGWLGSYKITAVGADLHFRSSVEKMNGDSGEQDFEANFPIRLMLEMYRLGEMEHMFLIPAIVPW